MIDWRAINKERKRLKRLSILYDFLGGVLGILSLIYAGYVILHLFLKDRSWAWYFFHLFSVGFIRTVSSSFFRAYDATFKRWEVYYFRYALLPFIKSNLPNFRYKLRRFFSKDEFLASYLFHDHPSPEEYTGRDYLKGSYRGLSFECSWVSCGYYTTNSDGESVYVDIFEGLVLKLNLHKPVDGVVLLYPDDTYSLKGFNRYRLDNEEFSRSFRVYSDSEFNAFYILDHAFMERLLKFKRAYPSARLSFVKNNLYIALPGFYLFYIPSIDQSVLKIEEEYKKNLSLFFSLLDSLTTERTATKLS